MRQQQYWILTVAFLLLAQSVSAASALYVQEKSGYNTTTQVSNQRHFFIKHRFTPESFSVWVKLATEAKANDTYTQLLRDGWLSGKGMATRTFSIHGRTFPENDGVRVSDLIPITPPPVDILAVLIEHDVLSKEGYLNGVTANLTTEFYNVDFGFLQQRISALPIGITDPSADAALKTELLNLIIGSHRGMETTVVETTRYQSRSDNIILNVIESWTGNALGSVFLPDRSKISTTQVAYIPALDVDGFYPRSFGFAQSPYEDNRSGIWSLNGLSTRTPLTVGGMQYVNGTQQFGNISFQNRIHLTGNTRRSFQFADLTVSYTSVEQYAETTQCVGFGVGAGRVDANFNWRAGINLGYVKAPVTQGVAYGASFETDWYVFNPFSLTIRGSILRNPNVSSDGQAAAGLGLTLFGVTARALYGIQSTGPDHNINTNQGVGFLVTIGL